jgi:hypothetical protein
MKFIFTLCLFFTIFFFDSCTTCSCKKVPCAAFNDTSFDQWFPYKSDDQMIFQNNSVSDTFSLYVDRSAAYETNQGCFGANGGCLAYCHMYSNELYSSYIRKMQFSIYNSSPKNMSFDLYQFNCQASDITDTGLIVIDSFSRSHYYPSMNVGGRTFSNVQLITRDTAASNKISGPYKIFLAKKVGIIAYEIYPDMTLWIKQ